MRAGGLPGLLGIREGDLCGGPEARRREGLDPRVFDYLGRRAARRGHDPAAAENAEAYRRAFPQGPPFFTGASTSPAMMRTILTSGCRGPSTSRAGTSTTRPAWTCSTAPGSDWAFYNGGNRWTYGDYMYKAAKQHGMKFRLSWHWNVVAGDPYYALDCREDDYAWCNACPDARLIPSVDFERLREGLDDYRRLITLDRLAHEAGDTAAGRVALGLIDTRMRAFHLGQRDHDAVFPPGDWIDFRRKVDDAIEALRKR